MGPLAMAVAALFMAGEFCVDAGSGCARGVVSVELLDTAGEWCVWGVVGGLDDAPLLGRRAEPREAVAGDCC
jgi:hypothetical protein